APRNSTEFARVLLTSGLLMVVIPGEAHLACLRSTLGLLNIEQQKQQHVVAQLSSQFALLETNSLRYNLLLRADAIRQAVMMTPNYWHLSTEIHKQLNTLEELETEANFICLLFRRLQ
ncbi:MAG: hypothetical protein J2P37_34365, partial [Ktedonobacteraceae bacterium]|nr:hypothetical protein [Ktedonobacteraceae bacterium]